MIKKAIAALALAASTALGAYAGDGVTVDAWAGASAGDVVGEPGASAMLGVALGNLFGKDIEIGIDEFVWSITPESSVGFDAYASFGIDLGESPVSLAVGPNFVVAFDEGIVADAGFSGTLGFSVGEVEVASVEIGAGFMEANEFAFSLEAILGAGYEFSIGDSGALALWAELGIDLFEKFAIGELEGSVEYTHSFGDAFALSLAITSVLTMADEVSVSLEPSIYARFSF